MSPEELKSLTESNAKAIEALANQQREDRAQAALDRQRLYSAMATLASAQAEYYPKLALQDELIATLSRRQGEIVQILKTLSQK